jgi:hypothetical protein
MPSALTFLLLGLVVFGLFFGFFFAITVPVLNIVPDLRGFFITAVVIVSIFVIASLMRLIFNALRPGKR